MFNFLKKKSPKTTPYQEVIDLIKVIIGTVGVPWYQSDLKKVRAVEELRQRPLAEIKPLVNEMLQYYGIVSLEVSKNDTEYYPNEDKAIGQKITLQVLLMVLLKKNLEYTEDEWMALMDVYTELDGRNAELKNYSLRITGLPIYYSIKQITYYLKNHDASEDLSKYIKSLLNWNIFSTDLFDDDSKKVAKVKAALNTILGIDDKAMAFKLKNKDIGEQVNRLIASLTEHQISYNVIFNHSSTVSGSKPSSKFTKAIDQQIDIIGANKYRKVVHAILAVPLDWSPYVRTITTEWQGTTYQHTVPEFICTENQNFIKGLVWTCSRYSDKETIRLLTKLCEKCYTKIPQKGPAAASVGNACIYIMGQMKGKDGLGALSRLKLKVRQNNVKKSIDKYLAAGAEKYNVSVEELKEMAVPDCKFEKGLRSISFADYNLDLSITDGKVKQQWVKPDGSTMKSVPAIVKNEAKLKSKLQRLRKEIKEIAKVLSAQKQRVDNQFILDRAWDYSTFSKYYLDHGLMYSISNKLIWTLETPKKTVNAIRIEDEWRTLDDKKVNVNPEESKVKLWHPIYADEAEIVAWRKRIMELEWKQPIKQAFREIYLITEAELNTWSYSNRMAAHILKQHQFNTLANLRDWKYSLMGWYDDGIHNQVCSKVLKKHKLKAEYWIDEINQEDAYNDAGIWHYVATDQVKFTDLEGNTVDLANVPKIVFTEVMRDVDLFVGVASVGNDPQWADNNGERQEHRDYWHSFSFGDLSQIAKTRKEILSNLLPRLSKLKGKAEIEGRFLVVKGSLRTYKIHIGSTNILMKPDDQYLCIVPSRSEKSTDKLYIPFEGDRGLSVVLSKAFLLAEDHKITDPTITSQIKRK